MNVVERAPVDLYMGLHNSHYCGGYFYLSHDDEALRRTSPRCSRRPRSPSIAASPRCRTSTPSPTAMFEAFDLRADYEYYARYGKDPAVALQGGDSSDSYATALWDCFTLVAEVPFFTSPKAGDQAAAGLTRREAKERGIEVWSRATSSGSASGTWRRRLTSRRSRRGSVRCRPG